MHFLFDPKLFNYLIMTLYVLNSAWWLYHRSWPDAGYWASAFCITACVTWGYQRVVT